MKAAVRYYTKGGNTRKVAEAMAEAIGVEAKSIDFPLEEKVDVLFLGKCCRLTRGSAHDDSICAICNLELDQSAEFIIIH